MYALLNVAFALLAGLLMTRIFSRWRLPDVTAFLVAGVLIGPFCLGRLGITGVGFAAYEDVAALGTISDVAMGFIAFAIGNEFRLEDLRKTAVRPSSSASCRRLSPPCWWISPCSASISCAPTSSPRRPPSRSARSPRRRLPPPR